MLSNHTRWIELIPELERLQWDNLPMLRLDPSDFKQISHAVHRAVRDSNLTLEEISQRLAKIYGVTLSPSGISKAVWRGSVRLQRALQILAVVGETEIIIGNEHSTIK